MNFGCIINRSRRTEGAARADESSLSVCREATEEDDSQIAEIAERFEHTDLTDLTDNFNVTQKAQKSQKNISPAEIAENADILLGHTELLEQRGQTKACFLYAEILYRTHVIYIIPDILEQLLKTGCDVLS